MANRLFMGGMKVTTSRQREFLSEILEWKPIPEDTLVYFQERLRHRLHSAILDAFTRRAEERGLRQKDLAARIHKSSVQINRWLSTASNLTLDSISDLMVGLGMDFDAFPFTHIESTVPVREEEREDKEKAELPNLLSVLGASAKPRLLDFLTEVNKTLKNWTEEMRSGSGSGSTVSVPSSPNARTTTDAAETLQKQVLSRKVIPLEEYRQKLRPKAVGENNSLLLQIEAR